MQNIWSKGMNMITETTRKVLDALEALETEVFYDAETGEYEFAYMVHDMVLPCH